MTSVPLASVLKSWAEDTGSGDTAAPTTQAAASKGPNGPAAQTLKGKKKVLRPMTEDEVQTLVTDVVGPYSQYEISRIMELQEYFDSYSYEPKSSDGGRVADDGSDPLFPFQSNASSIARILNSQVADENYWAEVRKAAKLDEETERGLDGSQAGSANEDGSPKKPRGYKGYVSDREDEQAGGYDDVYTTDDQLFSEGSSGSQRFRNRLARLRDELYNSSKVGTEKTLLSELVGFAKHLADAATNNVPIDALLTMIIPHKKAYEKDDPNVYVEGNGRADLQLRMMAAMLRFRRDQTNTLKRIVRSLVGQLEFSSLEMKRIVAEAEAEGSAEILQLRKKVALLEREQRYLYYRVYGKDGVEVFNHSLATGAFLNANNKDSDAAGANSNVDDPSNPNSVAAQRLQLQHLQQVQLAKMSPEQQRVDKQRKYRKEIDDAYTALRDSEVTKAVARVKGVKATGDYYLKKLEAHLQQQKEMTTEATLFAVKAADSRVRAHEQRRLMEIREMERHDTLPLHRVAPVKRAMRRAETEGVELFTNIAPGKYHSHGARRELLPGVKLIADGTPIEVKGSSNASKRAASPNNSRSGQQQPSAALAKALSSSDAFVRHLGRTDVRVVDVAEVMVKDFVPYIQSTARDIIEKIGKSGRPESGEENRGGGSAYAAAKEAASGGSRPGTANSTASPLETEEYKPSTHYKHEKNGALLRHLSGAAEVVRQSMCLLTTMVLTAACTGGSYGGTVHARTGYYSHFGGPPSMTPPLHMIERDLENMVPAGGAAEAAEQEGGAAENEGTADKSATSPMASARNRRSRQQSVLIGRTDSIVGGLNAAASEQDDAMRHRRSVAEAIQRSKNFPTAANAVRAMQEMKKKKRLAAAAAAKDAQASQGIESSDFILPPAPVLGPTSLLGDNIFFVFAAAHRLHNDGTLQHMCDRLFRLYMNAVEVQTFTDPYGLLTTGFKVDDRSRGRGRVPTPTQGMRSLASFSASRDDDPSQNRSQRRFSLSTSQRPPANTRDCGVQVRLEGGGGRSGPRGASSHSRGQVSVDYSVDELKSMLRRARRGSEGQGSAEDGSDTSQADTHASADPDAARARRKRRARASMMSVVSLTGAKRRGSRRRRDTQTSNASFASSISHVHSRHQMGLGDDNESQFGHSAEGSIVSDTYDSRRSSISPADATSTDHETDSNAATAAGQGGSRRTQRPKVHIVRDDVCAHSHSDSGSGSTISSDGQPPQQRQGQQYRQGASSRTGQGASTGTGAAPATTGGRHRGTDDAAGSDRTHSPLLHYSSGGKNDDHPLQQTPGSGPMGPEGRSAGRSGGTVVAFDLDGDDSDAPLSDTTLRFRGQTQQHGAAGDGGESPGGTAGLAGGSNSGARGGETPSRHDMDVSQSPGNASILVSTHSRSDYTNEADGAGVAAGSGDGSGKVSSKTGAKTGATGGNSSARGTAKTPKNTGHGSARGTQQRLAGEKPRSARGQASPTSPPLSSSHLLESSANRSGSPRLAGRTASTRTLLAKTQQQRPPTVDAATATKRLKTRNAYCQVSFVTAPGAAGASKSVDAENDGLADGDIHTDRWRLVTLLMRRLDPSAIHHALALVSEHVNRQQPTRPRAPSTALATVSIPQSGVAMAALRALACSAGRSLFSNVAQQRLFQQLPLLSKDVAAQFSYPPTALLKASPTPVISPLVVVKEYLIVARVVALGTLQRQLPAATANALGQLHDLVNTACDLVNQRYGHIPTCARSFETEDEANTCNGEGTRPILFVRVQRAQDDVVSIVATSVRANNNNNNESGVNVFDALAVLVDMVQYIEREAMHLHYDPALLVHPAAAEVALPPHAALRRLCRHLETSRPTTAEQNMFDGQGSLLSSNQRNSMRGSAVSHTLWAGVDDFVRRSISVTRAQAPRRAGNNKRRPGGSVISEGGDGPVASHTYSGGPHPESTTIKSSDSASEEWTIGGRPPADTGVVGEIFGREAGRDDSVTRADSRRSVTQTAPVQQHLHAAGAHHGTFRFGSVVPGSGAAPDAVPTAMSIQTNGSNARALLTQRCIRAVLHGGAASSSAPQQMLVGYDPLSITGDSDDRNENGSKSDDDWSAALDTDALPPFVSRGLRLQFHIAETAVDQSAALRSGDMDPFTADLRRRSSASAASQEAPALACLQEQVRDPMLALHRIRHDLVAEALAHDSGDHRPDTTTIRSIPSFSQADANTRNSMQRLPPQSDLDVIATYVDAVNTITNDDRICGPPSTLAMKIRDALDTESFSSISLQPSLVMQLVEAASTSSTSLGQELQEGGGCEELQKSLLQNGIVRLGNTLSGYRKMYFVCDEIGCDDDDSDEDGKDKKSSKEGDDARDGDPFKNNELLALLMQVDPSILLDSGNPNTPLSHVILQNKQLLSALLKKKQDHLNALQLVRKREDEQLSARDKLSTSMETTAGAGTDSGTDAWASTSVDRSSSFRSSATSRSGHQRRGGNANSDGPLSGTEASQRAQEATEVLKRVILPTFVAIEIKAVDEILASSDLLLSLSNKNNKGTGKATSADAHSSVSVVGKRSKAAPFDPDALAQTMRSADAPQLSPRDLHKKLQEAAIDAAVQSATSAAATQAQSGGGGPSLAKMVEGKSAAEAARHVADYTKAQEDEKRMSELHEGLATAVNIIKSDIFSVVTAHCTQSSATGDNDEMDGGGRPAGGGGPDVTVTAGLSTISDLFATSDVVMCSNVANFSKTFADCVARAAMVNEACSSRDTKTLTIGGGFVRQEDLRLGDDDDEDDIAANAPNRGGGQSPLFDHYQQRMLGSLSSSTVEPPEHQRADCNLLVFACRDEATAVEIANAAHAAALNAPYPDLFFDFVPECSPQYEGGGAGATPSTSQPATPRGALDLAEDDDVGVQRRVAAFRSQQQGRGRLLWRGVPVRAAVFQTLPSCAVVDDAQRAVRGHDHVPAAEVFGTGVAEAVRLLSAARFGESVIGLATYEQLQTRAVDPSDRTVEKSGQHGRTSGTNERDQQRTSHAARSALEASTFSPGRLPAATEPLKQRIGSYLLSADGQITQNEVDSKKRESTADGDAQREQPWMLFYPRFLQGRWNYFNRLSSSAAVSHAANSTDPLPPITYLPPASPSASGGAGLGVVLGRLHGLASDVLFHSPMAAAALLMIAENTSPTAAAAAGEQYRQRRLSSVLPGAAPVENRADGTGANASDAEDVDDQLFTAPGQMLPEGIMYGGWDTAAETASYFYLYRRSSMAKSAASQKLPRKRAPKEEDNPIATGGGPRLRDQMEIDPFARIGQLMHLSASRMDVASYRRRSEAEGPLVSVAHAAAYTKAHGRQPMAPMIAPIAAALAYGGCAEYLGNANTTEREEGDGKGTEPGTLLVGDHWDGARHMWYLAGPGSVVFSSCRRRYGRSYLPSLELIGARHAVAQFALEQRQLAAAANNSPYRTSLAAKPQAAVVVIELHKLVEVLSLILSEYAGDIGIVSNEVICVGATTTTGGAATATAEEGEDTANPLDNRLPKQPSKGHYDDLDPFSASLALFSASMSSASFEPSSSTTPRTLDAIAHRGPSKAQMRKLHRRRLQLLAAASTIVNQFREGVVAAALDVFDGCEARVSAHFGNNTSSNSEMSPSASTLFADIPLFVIPAVQRWFAPRASQHYGRKTTDSAAVINGDFIRHVFAASLGTSAIHSAWFKNTHHTASGDGGAGRVTITAVFADPLKAFLFAQHLQTLTPDFFPSKATVASAAADQLIQKALRDQQHKSGSVEDLTHEGGKKSPKSHRSTPPPTASAAPRSPKAAAGAAVSRTTSKTGAAGAVAAAVPIGIVEATNVLYETVKVIMEAFGSFGAGSGSGTNSRRGTATAGADGNRGNDSNEVSYGGLMVRAAVHFGELTVRASQPPATNALSASHLVVTLSGADATTSGDGSADLSVGCLFGPLLEGEVLAHRGALSGSSSSSHVFAGTAIAEGMRALNFHHAAVVSTDEMEPGVNADGGTCGLNTIRAEALHFIGGEVLVTPQLVAAIQAHPVLVDVGPTKTSSSVDSQPQSKEARKKALQCTRRRVMEALSEACLVYATQEHALSEPHPSAKADGAAPQRRSTDESAEESTEPNQTPSGPWHRLFQKRSLFGSASNNKTKSNAVALSSTSSSSHVVHVIAAPLKAKTGMIDVWTRRLYQAAGRILKRSPLRTLLSFAGLELATDPAASSASRRASQSVESNSSALPLLDLLVDDDSVEADEDLFADYPLYFTALVGQVVVDTVWSLALSVREATSSSPGAEHVSIARDLAAALGPFAAHMLMLDSSAPDAVRTPALSLHHRNALIRTWLSSPLTHVGDMTPHAMHTPASTPFGGGLGGPSMQRHVSPQQRALGMSGGAMAYAQHPYPHKAQHDGGGAFFGAAQALHAVKTQRLGLTLKQFGVSPTVSPAGHPLELPSLHVARLQQQMTAAGTLHPSNHANMYSPPHSPGHGATLRTGVSSPTLGSTRGGQTDRYERNAAAMLSQRAGTSVGASDLLLGTNIQRLFRQLGAVSVKAGRVMGYPALGAASNPAPFDAKLRELIVLVKRVTAGEAPPSDVDIRSFHASALEVVEQMQKITEATMTALHCRPDQLSRFHRTTQTAIVIPPSGNDDSVFRDASTGDGGSPRGGRPISGGDGDDATGRIGARSRQSTRNKSVTLALASRNGRRGDADGLSIKPPSEFRPGADQDITAVQLRERRLMELERQLMEAQSSLRRGHLFGQGASGGGVGGGADEQQHQLQMTEELFSRLTAFSEERNQLSLHRAVSPVEITSGGGGGPTVAGGHGQGASRLLIGAPPKAHGKGNTPNSKIATAGRLVPLPRGAAAAAQPQPLSVSSVASPPPANPALLAILQSHQQISRSLPPIPHNPPSNHTAPHSSQLAAPSGPMPVMIHRINADSGDLAGPFRSRTLTSSSVAVRPRPLVGQRQQHGGGQLLVHNHLSTQNPRRASPVAALELTKLSQLGSEPDYTTDDPDIEATSRKSVSFARSLTVEALYSHDESDDAEGAELRTSQRSDGTDQDWTGTFGEADNSPHDTRRTTRQLSSSSAGTCDGSRAQLPPFELSLDPANLLRQSQESDEAESDNNASSKEMTHSKTSRPSVQSSSFKSTSGVDIRRRQTRQPSMMNTTTRTPKRNRSVAAGRMSVILLVKPSLSQSELGEVSIYDDPSKLYSAMCTSLGVPEQMQLRTELLARVKPLIPELQEATSAGSDGSTSQSAASYAVPAAFAFLGLPAGLADAVTVDVIFDACAARFLQRLRASAWVPAPTGSGGEVTSMSDNDDTTSAPNQSSKPIASYSSRRTTTTAITEPPVSPLTTNINSFPVLSGEDLRAASTYDARYRRALHFLHEIDQRTSRTRLREARSVELASVAVEESAQRTLAEETARARERLMCLFMLPLSFQRLFRKRADEIAAGKVLKLLMIPLVVRYLHRRRRAKMIDAIHEAMAYAPLTPLHLRPFFGSQFHQYAAATGNAHGPNPPPHEKNSSPSSSSLGATSTAMTTQHSPLLASGREAIVLTARDAKMVGPLLLSSVTATINGPSAVVDTGPPPSAASSRKGGSTYSGVRPIVFQGEESPAELSAESPNSPNCASPEPSSCSGYTPSSQRQQPLFTTVERTYPAIASHPLFSRWPPGALAHLTRLGRLHVYTAGEMIFYADAEHYFDSENFTQSAYRTSSLIGAATDGWSRAQGTIRGAAPSNVKAARLTRYESAIEVCRQALKSVCEHSGVASDTDGGASSPPAAASASAFGLGKGSVSRSSNVAGALPAPSPSFRFNLSAMSVGGGGSDNQFKIRRPQARRNWFVAADRQLHKATANKAKGALHQPHHSSGGSAPSPLAAAIKARKRRQTNTALSPARTMSPNASQTNDNRKRHAASEPNTRTSLDALEEGVDTNMKEVTPPLKDGEPPRRHVPHPPPPAHRQSASLSEGTMLENSTSKMFVGKAPPSPISPQSRRKTTHFSKPPHASNDTTAPGAATSSTLPTLPTDHNYASANLDYVVIVVAGDVVEFDPAAVRGAMRLQRRLVASSEVTASGGFSAKSERTSTTSSAFFGPASTVFNPSAMAAAIAGAPNAALLGPLFSAAVAYHGPGSVLGAPQALAGAPFRRALRCETDVVAYRIPVRTFLQLVHGHGESKDAPPQSTADEAKGVHGMRSGSPIMSDNTSPTARSPTNASSPPRSPTSRRCGGRSATEKKSADHPDAGTSYYKTDTVNLAKNSCRGAFIAHDERVDEQLRSVEVAQHLMRTLQRGISSSGGANSKEKRILVQLAKSEIGPLLPKLPFLSGGGSMLQYSAAAAAGMLTLLLGRLKAVLCLAEVFNQTIKWSSLLATTTAGNASVSTSMASIGGDGGNSPGATSSSQQQQQELAGKPITFYVSELIQTSQSLVRDQHDCVLSMLAGCHPLLSALPLSGLRLLRDYTAGNISIQQRSVTGGGSASTAPAPAGAGIGRFATKPGEILCHDLLHPGGSSKVFILLRGHASVVTVKDLIVYPEDILNPTSTLGSGRRQTLVSGAAMGGQHGSSAAAPASQPKHLKRTVVSVSNAPCGVALGMNAVFPWEDASKSPPVPLTNAEIASIRMHLKRFSSPQQQQPLSSAAMPAALGPIALDGTTMSTTFVGTSAPTAAAIPPPSATNAIFSGLPSPGAVFQSQVLVSDSYCEWLWVNKRALLTVLRTTTKAAASYLASPTDRIVATSAIAGGGRGGNGSDHSQQNLLQDVLDAVVEHALQNHPACEKLMRGAIISGLSDRRASHLFNERMPGLSDSMGGGGVAGPRQPGRVKTLANTGAEEMKTKEPVLELLGNRALRMLAGRCVVRAVPPGQAILSAPYGSGGAAPGSARSGQIPDFRVSSPVTVAPPRFMTSTRAEYGVIILHGFASQKFTQPRTSATAAVVGGAGGEGSHPQGSAAGAHPAHPLLHYEWSFFGFAECLAEVPVVYDLTAVSGCIIATLSRQAIIEAVVLSGPNAHSMTAPSGIGTTSTAPDDDGDEPPSGDRDDEGSSQPPTSRRRTSSATSGVLMSGGDRRVSAGPVRDPAVFQLIERAELLTMADAALRAGPDGRSDGRLGDHDANHLARQTKAEEIQAARLRCAARAQQWLQQENGRAGDGEGPTPPLHKARGGNAGQTSPTQGGKTSYESLVRAQHFKMVARDMHRNNIENRLLVALSTQLGRANPSQSVATLFEAPSGEARHNNQSSGGAAESASGARAAIIAQSTTSGGKDPLVADYLRNVMSQASVPTASASFYKTTASQQDDTSGGHSGPSSPLQRSERKQPTSSDVLALAHRTPISVFREADAKALLFNPVATSTSVPSTAVSSSSKPPAALNINHHHHSTVVGGASQKFGVTIQDVFFSAKHEEVNKTARSPSSLLLGGSSMETSSSSAELHIQRVIAEATEYVAKTARDTATGPKSLRSTARDRRLFGYSAVSARTTAEDQRLLGQIRAPFPPAPASGATTTILSICSPRVAPLVTSSTAIATTPTVAQTTAVVSSPASKRPSAVVGPSAPPVLLAPELRRSVFEPQKLAPNDSPNRQPPEITSDALLSPTFVGGLSPPAGTRKATLRGSVHTTGSSAVNSRVGSPATAADTPWDLQKGHPHGHSTAVFSPVTEHEKQLLSPSSRLRKAVKQLRKGRPASQAPRGPNAQHSPRTPTLEVGDVGDALVATGVRRTVT